MPPSDSPRRVGEPPTLPQARVYQVALRDEDLRLFAWWPDSEPPWPVVVRMHGVTERAADLPPWTLDLLDFGIGVVSFSGRRHGERGPGPEAYRAWLREDPANRYIQVISGTAQDIVDVVAWLSVQPQMAPESIGLWGGSFGATCCLAAAHIVRPQAVGSICGRPGFAEPMRSGQMSLVRPEDFHRLTPESRSLMSRFDPLLHLGEIAPAALLLVHGDRDEIVPPAGQRTLYHRLVPHYDEMPDRLAFLSHPGGHATPPWCEQAAVWWLRAWLRPDACARGT